MATADGRLVSRDTTLFQRHLCVLRPHNFSRLGHEAKLRDIHFDNRALRDDAESCKQSRLGVLLHADDVQAESHLEFRMGYVGLLHSERRRPDVFFEFRRFTGEVLADERNLVHNTFPLLPLAFACDVNQ